MDLRRNVNLAPGIGLRLARNAISEPDSEDSPQDLPAAHSMCCRLASSRLRTALPAKVRTGLRQRPGRLGKQVCRCSTDRSVPSSASAMRSTKVAIISCCLGRSCARSTNRAAIRCFTFGENTADFTSLERHFHGAGLKSAVSLRRVKWGRSRSLVSDLDGSFTGTLPETGLSGYGPDVGIRRRLADRWIMSASDNSGHSPGPRQTAAKSQSRSLTPTQRRN